MVVLFFLYIGSTLTMFSLFGNIPDEKHWLIRSVMDGLISRILMFSVLILIES